MPAKFTPDKFLRVFWSRVDRSGGPDSCWIWTAASNEFGYGITWFRNKLWKAHRVSWVIVHGNIPQGQQVLHSCDNPACVNPSHLFLGDRSDNMQDMNSKLRNRQPMGEGHNAAVLTDEIVREARQLAAQGWTDRQLADRYGCSPGAIYQAVNRLTWKHVA